MTVVLVYPPTCDPTAPYIAVPMLTGFLREAGVDVLPVDANVEAWDEVLTAERMGLVRDRIVSRISALEKRRSLDHVAQVEYATLHEAYAEAHAVPRGIEEAKAVLRDADAFYRPDRYGDAVATIDAAMRALSAAYHPLHVDFMTYRTPFGLLAPENARADARRERNPFCDYVERTLAPRLVELRPLVIGISVCFPGQLQPAYSFAYQLRARLPNVHFTCGGPGLTQILTRLRGAALARALGPFDTAVVYEGEAPLLALVRALESGGDLRRVPNLIVRDTLASSESGSAGGRAPAWTKAESAQDLSSLPAPDFDGLPLHRYFAPKVVLPYDPTRGCYWGKCAFCHYGLADAGTARYRERPLQTVVRHLGALKQRYHTRHFYFSQDSVAPKSVVALADALIDASLDLRWATDLKPEAYLSEERARRLADAGAVACALGVESGDDRVLRLIQKGASVSTVSAVIDHLARADIAAEAMCFTDFPTETGREAMRTLDFLRRKADRLGLFIVGEFGLTHGSRVARDPVSYGIAEIWGLQGDEFELGVFYTEGRPPKTEEDRVAVETALRQLSEKWLLRPYPWAGAISTAHTILYYDEFGPGVFRKLATNRASRVLAGPALSFRREAMFDLRRASTAITRDANLWAHLIHEERTVSRSLYEKLATQAPRLSASPAEWHLVPGSPPQLATTQSSHPDGQHRESRTTPTSGRRRNTRPQEFARHFGRKKPRK